MSSIDRLVILLSKIVAFLIRTLRIGAGATWPGEIALRFRPSILQTFTNQPISIILVAGTNGKTTTAKMIDTILKKAKIPVRRNESGANLDNGLVSTFIQDCDLFGNFRSQYFIFEVDEATLPNVLKRFSPNVLVLLNLFRDQLDRYGEVDTIATKWMNALKRLDGKTKIIINGDDPQLAFIGKNFVDTHDVYFFGLDDPELFLPSMEHATDSIFCPSCGNRLTFGGVYFSHLGKWACGRCGFIHPKLTVTRKDFMSPLEGVYNIYNTLASGLAGRIIGLSDELIQQALSSFTPAFGRMEEIVFHRRRFTILLSKNPTGLNESIRTVLSSEKKGPILLVLNDRIPDGRDVSWIWDADVEMLASFPLPIIISGDRCYDMAVRVKYAGVQEKHIVVFSTIQESIQKTIETVDADQHIWILPTYSAMLEVRKVLTGRKIL
ncbi:MAG: Mur ligase family protein [Patescibacteria group bacterium]|nr:Mur ligase family protein [Patescibacteria group bacterium]